MNAATVSFANYNGELYIAGGFTVADGDSTVRFLTKLINSELTDSCSSPVIPDPVVTGQLLFPNPATDKVYLNISGLKGAIVYTIDGRQVMSISEIGIPTGIDVSALAAGHYVVRAFTNEQVYTMRLVKQ